MTRASIGENTRVTRSMSRENEALAPNIDDIVEFAMVGGTDDSYVNPKNFENAWNHENEYERLMWRNAIKKEFNDMFKHKVWEKVKKTEIPSDRRILGNKWVLKKKKNGVYRARLVALGYHQIPGIDHEDNFAPVINETTFRIILILMMKENLKAEIVDIETAFLYGNLEEEIFMKQPQGLKYMENESDTDNEYVLVLKQSIYGLVQAARQFFKKLRDVLIEKMGFEKCLINQCLLSRKGESGILIICLYIDDTMIVGNKIEIKNFKEEIKLHFKTKEEGEMKDYVGCMIQKKNDEIFLHQSDLIKKLEKEFEEELKEVRKVETPAIAGEGIVMAKEDEKIEDGRNI